MVDWLSESRASGAARPPRVLILSASVGTGHLRAAEAIELALRQVQPGALVRNVDIFSFATPPFRLCYADSYLYLREKWPAFVGSIYNLMDRPDPPSNKYLSRLKVWLEWMNLRRLLGVLSAEPWDLVINTFFLSTEVIAWLRRHGRFDAPQVQVVTDFETHGNWVNDPCELYCTATEESALYLETYGVPRGRAVVTGIPIHPVYSQAKDRAACLARLEVPGDRPVLLVLGGGHAVRHLEDVYRTLLKVERPLQIVVVTGRNTAARQRLQKLEPPARHHTRILGYTEQMDDWLGAADLVVTKPGGLTVAESLARGAGMVIVHPVPGQEERNSDYLLEHGAAIKANHLPTLPLKVRELLDDPVRLLQLKANARRLARPRAAFDVVEHSLALLLWLAGDGTVSSWPKEREESHEVCNRLATDGSRFGRPLARGEQLV
jgi:processive 1,2-diacylglycerol beta-glucosyltransferase